MKNQRRSFKLNRNESVCEREALIASVTFSIDGFVVMMCVFARVILFQKLNESEVKVETGCALMRESRRRDKGLIVGRDKTLNFQA